MFGCLQVFLFWSDFSQTLILLLCLRCAAIRAEETRNSPSVTWKANVITPNLFPTSAPNRNAATPLLTPVFAKVTPQLFTTGILRNSAATPMSTPSTRQPAIPGVIPGMNCLNTWTFVPDSRVPASNSTLSLQASTESACKQLCIATASCNAADYINSQCWLSSFGNRTIVGGSPGANHWALTRAVSCGVCSDLWTLTKNMMNDDTVFDSLTTNSDCLSKCLTSSNCTGFNLQTMLGSFYFKCYLTSSTSSNLSSVPNSYHYDLTRSTCTNMETSTEKLHFTPAVMVSLSTSGPYFRNTPTMSTMTTTGNPVTCSFSWRLFSNFRSVVSTIPKYAGTEDDCKDICISWPSCVAIDFTAQANSSYRCGIVQATDFNSSDVNLTTSLGSNHYYLTRSQACGNACLDSWTLVPDTRVPASNSTLTMQASTESTCKRLCVATVGCLAVDFNSAHCWMTFVTIQPVVGDSLGTNHWDLNRSRVCGFCADVWTVSLTTADDRSVFDSQTTEVDCRSKCLANPNCTGFDTQTLLANTNIRCSFSLSTSPVLSTRSNSFHYDLTRSLCKNKTITGATTTSTTTTQSSPDNAPVQNYSAASKRSYFTELTVILPAFVVMVTGGLATTFGKIVSIENFS